MFPIFIVNRKSGKHLSARQMNIPDFHIELENGEIIWGHCLLTRSWLFLYILCSSKWRLLQGRLCSRSTSEFWCHCWSLTEKWCGIMNSNGSTIFCERDVLHYLDVEDISWYNPIRLSFLTCCPAQCGQQHDKPLVLIFLDFSIFQFYSPWNSGCFWLQLVVIIIPE